MDNNNVGVDETSIPTCSVQQLARYINNKTHDIVSNYTMLLGSGCSVTSNIRSGEQLIKEWKEQGYYEKANDSDCNDIEKKVEEFFEKNSFDWFKRDKAYQSLFEYLYPISADSRLRRTAGSR